MKDKTILLTCGGSGGTPGNIRFLSKLEKYNARIILADSNPASGNLFLPEVSKSYQIPTVSSEDLINVLLKIIHTESVDYLYSGLDEEIQVISKHRDLIEQAGCKLLLPDHKALELTYDKSKLAKSLIGKARIPYTLDVTRDLDSDDFWGKCDGNVVIKVTNGRGGALVNIPHSLNEFKFYIEQANVLSNSKNLKFIVQQRIMGVEWGVSTFHGLNGELLYAVSRKKFDDVEVITNTVIAGIEENTSVIEYTIDVINALGLNRGINSTEVRVSDSDGQPYLIEINGGRCAAHDINLLGGGINVMEVFMDVLNGVKVEPFQHPDDTIVSLRRIDYMLVTRDQINSIESPINQKKSFFK